MSIYRFIYIRSEILKNSKINPVIFQVINMTSNEFVCWSPQLYMFLRGKRIASKKTGIHRQNGKTYVVFDIDENLESALREWKATKPK